LQLILASKRVKKLLSGEKEMKLIVLLMFLGGLVLVGVGRLADLTVSSGPSATVTKYYELALDGQIDQALRLWTDCSSDSAGCVKSTAVSGKDPHQEWTELINKYRDTIVKIESEKIDTNQASVLINLENARGTKDRIIYKLVKNNGEWKIYTYSTPTFEEIEDKLRKENVIN
jgi:hypothetical protein